MDCAAQDGGTTLSVLRNATAAQASIGSFYRQVLNTPVQVLAADVDGANGKDLIVLNLGSSATGDKIQVFRQNPALPNRFPFVFDEQLTPTTAKFIAMTTADLNGDGRPDLAVTYRDGSDVFVNSYLRNPAGTAFTAGTPQVLAVDSGTCPCTSCSTGTSASGLVLADFNKDNKLDAVVSVRSGPRQLFAATGDGAGGFAACPQALFAGTQVFATPLTGVLTPMAARDLDCDGKPEIIGVSNETPQRARILHNDSATGGAMQFSVFANLSLPAASNNPDIRSIATGTFPGAAGPFIAVADFANDRIIVFLSAGSGSYSVGTAYQLGARSNPVPLTASDFDADGDDDLVAADKQTNKLSVLANKGDGTFTWLSPDLQSGISPNAVAAFDLDGNGRPDLIHVGGSGSSWYLRVNSLDACAAVAGCLKGDMNQDGLVDGRDIQLFAKTLLNPSSATGWQRCAADMDSNQADAIVTDLPRFVCKLLYGDAGCPVGCPVGTAEYIPPLVDCNGNGVADDQDIATGTSLDCNLNGVPDECETGSDCNGNHIPDYCDIASGYSLDCNHNDFPDECDLALPPPWGALDCNENGIPDSCDIASGYSQDTNLNHIPDECEGGARMFSSQQASGTEASPTGGEGYNWDEDAAWAAFYDWAFQQTWGPASEYSGAEQTQRTLDKLGELGLPEEAPAFRP